MTSSSSLMGTLGGERGWCGLVDVSIISMAHDGFGHNFDWGALAT